MYLRRRGFNALAGWGSGHAILKLVLEKTPDVAVIDLDLPELDGLEVARQLRGRIGRATVLVALTGNSQDTDRMRSKEAGFDHFLVKPDLHGLLKILSDVALSGAHEHQAA